MAQVDARQYNEFKVEKLIQLPQKYSCVEYKNTSGSGELILRNQEVIANMFRQDIDGDIQYFFFIYG